jgi:hypothetical protein
MSRVRSKARTRPYDDRMADIVTSPDVVAAAIAAEAALRPAIGRDWSVRAGPLEWNVEQTITHMIAATAKYTLYLASRSEHFIGVSIGRWADATNEEVVDSLVPVAVGLANVAAAAPPGVRAYHVTGPSTAADYLGRACVEILVHTDDALTGPRSSARARLPSSITTPLSHALPMPTRGATCWPQLDGRRPDGRPAARRPPRYRTPHSTRLEPRCQSVPTSANPAARSASAWAASFAPSLL